MRKSEERIFRRPHEPRTTSVGSRLVCGNIVIAEGVEDTSMVSPKDPVLHCTEILYVLVISTLPVGIFV